MALNIAGDNACGKENITLVRQLIQAHAYWRLISGIYTPSRFGNFDGEYKKAPWEGHFRHYEVREGMRVPQYGEVGWYNDGGLQLVWKASITDARYDLGPSVIDKSMDPAAQVKAGNGLVSLTVKPRRWNCRK